MVSPILHALHALDRKGWVIKLDLRAFLADTGRIDIDLLDPLFSRARNRSPADVDKMSPYYFEKASEGRVASFEGPEMKWKSPSHHKYLVFTNRTLVCEVYVSRRLCTRPTWHTVADRRRPYIWCARFCALFSLFRPLSQRKSLHRKIEQPASGEALLSVRYVQWHLLR